MDCVMIAIFGASAIMSFVQGEYMGASLFLLLVLAWSAILIKDLEIGHYAKLIDLYKEAMKENDEFLDKLLGYINEKQKDNDTDTPNQR